MRKPLLVSWMQKPYASERRPLRKQNARHVLKGRLSPFYWKSRRARKRYSEPAWLTKNRLEDRRILKAFRRSKRRAEWRHEMSQRNQ